MSIGAQGKLTVRFGVFELNLDREELRRSGRLIRLQHQPFILLSFLASQAGRLVTRKEIQDEIWGHNTFVDFEQGVNFCIRQIRMALGDDPSAPRFIETIPRSGYRFIAPVENLASVQASSPPEAHSVQPVNSSGTRPRLRTGVIVAAVLAVVILGSVSLLRHSLFHKRELGSGKVMLVVLPFDNLTGDAEQDYLSDGMTEEMIAQLGRLNPQGLGIIARTSAIKYKGGNRSIGEIGRELGVQYILKGSIRRNESRLRVTAQLIQVSDSTHIWAQAYDRDLHDILAVEGEVAQAIAQEILIHLPSGERARLGSGKPVDPKVYQLYLKGRFFWNKRSAEGLKKATDYFDQAIAADPGYAPAYAGLADTYIVGYYSGLRPGDYHPKAEAAAKKALDLDDQLAEAHTALAAVKLDYDWDWLGAEREFKRAIDLNPSYGTAHLWYASYLAAMGRGEESIAEARLAQQVDPLSPITNAGLGLYLLYVGKYVQAVEQCGKALELDSNFAVGHLNLARALQGKGMVEQAIMEFQQAVALSAENPAMVAALGHAYASSGQRQKAQKLLNQLRKRSAREYVSPYDIAIIYAGLDDTDQTFTWLEKAYAEHSSSLVYLKVDPRLAGIRADPRFVNLERRLGLPTYTTVEESRHRGTVRPL